MVQNLLIRTIQVLAYDSKEAKVLDTSFRYVPSGCPKGGCKDCISVRQSRFEEIHTLECLPLLIMLLPINLTKFLYQFCCQSTNLVRILRVQ
ncbi:hypothetical protein CEXT_306781 [Caerostris extrusa]|uniref:Uncharacterized protein n=1 Tax=Caerostris extrusa TaxID=172846 RepID=A0AAV4YCA0_CAEEX|nr:hypothetical protein CEXT_306781 [Caerostris extrusa]